MTNTSEIQWNHGARIYARAAASHANSAKYANWPGFVRELIFLDSSRMLMWAPDQRSSVNMLEQETSLIVNAVSALENNRPHDCLACTQGLRNMKTETIFVDCVATILENSLPAAIFASNKPAVQLALEDLNSLKNVITALQKSFGIGFQQAGDALGKWILHLTYWIDVGGRL